MTLPPTGPFHQAVDRIPLMKVAFKIGLLIRNYMADEEVLTASSVLHTQRVVLGDHTISDTFEITILMFMLAQYNYLGHSADTGYTVNESLLEEFPVVDEWLEDHEAYLELTDRLECSHLWFELLFRRHSWIAQGKLRALDLHDLMITNLAEDVFQPFPELSELRLHRNLLYDLPGDLFAELPRLKKVDLSRNMISTLPLHIFANNARLQVVNLSGNGIDHGWLTKFRSLNKLTRHELEIII